MHFRELKTLTRSRNIPPHPSTAGTPFSPSASVSPLPHFQPRYSASMIANMHNDSISRGPAEIPHWCWETLSCRHMAGNLSAVRAGAWRALARENQKPGCLLKKKKIIINLFFLLIKMKCKLCSGLLEQLAASSHYEAGASAMEA